MRASMVSLLLGCLAWAGCAAPAPSCDEGTCTGCCDWSGACIPPEDPSCGKAPADSGVVPQWVADPGLTAAQLGVLVNEADPVSVRVAEAYVQARQIPPQNVVRLSFDAGDVLPLSVFAPLKQQADDQALDAGVQAWAITWTTPYRVDCMSIGTAFAAGFDAGFCGGSNGCSATPQLPTFDDEGDLTRSARRPFDSWGVRPTMMLATGADAGTALALIARGISADDTNPGGDGYFFRALLPIEWAVLRL